MPAKKTAPKPKTAQPTKPHITQTPVGYIVVGLALWTVGYFLAILAVESGSLLQWLGAIVGFVWGLIRIAEGLFKLLKRK